MHNRPRQPYGVPEDPQRVEARRKKYEQFKQLTELVLQNVRARKCDEKSLEQSAQLLRKNADVYTIWNYRKEALASLLEGKDGREKAKEIAAQELKLTEEALMENPKSYTAWYHRLWIIQKGLLPVETELKKVNRFLELDGRNFMAWKYRREVVKLAGTDLEDELAYSRQLIDQDFSNYSAWHARSALLTNKYTSSQVVSFQELMSKSYQGPTAAKIPLEALDAEFELVKSAFFTDPEDQSAYFYHKWLLKALTAHASAEPHTGWASDTVKAVLQRLETEEKSCRELLEEEPDRKLCKWPLQSLAHILCQQKAYGSRDHQEEIRTLYQELIEVDPYRAGFYRDAMADH